MPLNFFHGIITTHFHWLQFIKFTMQISSKPFLYLEWIDCLIIISQLNYLSLGLHFKKIESELVLPNLTCYDFIWQIYFSQNSFNFNLYWLDLTFHTEGFKNKLTPPQGSNRKIQKVQYFVGQMTCFFQKSVSRLEKFTGHNQMHGKVPE